jgi:hypothetical protein
MRPIYHQTDNRVQAHIPHARLDLSATEALNVLKF